MAMEPKPNARCGPILPLKDVRGAPVYRYTGLSAEKVSTVAARSARVMALRPTRSGVRAACGIAPANSASLDGFSGNCDPSVVGRCAATGCGSASLKMVARLAPLTPSISE